jgi:branched-chain amino acid transport system permease protein
MIDYAIAILTFTCIYAFIAFGLNTQWGLTGLINLGQVAFFAVGAYTTALATTSGLPFFLALPLAAALAGTLGGIVAMLTPHLREDYLAIVTLGFSELVRLVFLNEQWLANGPDGITQIPRPFALGAAGSEVQFLGIVALALGLCLAFCLRLGASPFGRVLMAIREDETVAEAVGKPTLAFKIQAFVIGAALAGIGGSFFAAYLTFISPDMFGASVSIFVLTAVLMGRQGSYVGTLLGVVVVSALLEGTRLLKDHITIVDGVELAALRFVVLGLGLMLIVLMRYGRAERA